MPRSPRPKAATFSAGSRVLGRSFLPRRERALWSASVRLVSTEILLGFAGSIGRTRFEFALCSRCINLCSRSDGMLRPLLFTVLWFASRQWAVAADKP